MTLIFSIDRQFNPVALSARYPWVNSWYKNEMKTVTTLLLSVQFLILPQLPLLAQTFIWPVSTPEAQGIDPAGIEAALTDIASGDYGDIRSLLIIKNGQLVTEDYFISSGVKAPVYSITKSIGSALLGIAQQRGADIDVERSMLSYMPQYADIVDFDNKSAITLENLLTQRHGLDWDEWTIQYEQPNNPVTIMLNTSDWYRTVLDWPLATAPDTDFAYSTGASSLMSVVLNNVTGMTPYQFANEALFAPLDITDTRWELVGANGIAGTGISEFPNDLEPLGFGIWLKPYDMAKIGELFRLGGVWQGQRLLSETWVEASVQPRNNGITDPDIFASANFGYGYQWWTLSFTDSLNRTWHSYYASGYGRQYIFVFPEADMVVVSTAKDFFYDDVGIGYQLRNNILPALIDGPQGHLSMNSDLNGSWYWPENSGQGINLEILNDGTEALAYWYTYDSDNNQRWFIMQGEIADNAARVTIRSTDNGSFVYSDLPDVSVWGTGELFFNSCSSGTFQFISEVENVSGEIPLTRLTGGELCTKVEALSDQPGWVN